MSDDPNLERNKLKALRTRAGLTTAEISKRLGVSQSTYASYEHRYAKQFLPMELVHRLVPILWSMGDPPILEADVLELGGAISTGVGYAVPNAIPVEGPALERLDLPRDVPVFGTASGSSVKDGAFLLNSLGGPIDYVRRPPGLQTNRSAFAMYVENDSMWPKFEPGDLVYLDPGRPPMIGGYVCVEIAVNGDENTMYCFIKRLVKRTSERLVLEQFNPPGIIEFDHYKVRKVIRVLSTGELLGV